ncbi:MAG: hypothetical protein R3301_15520, partial [Saprospiraceae bacterium]|nr:hypothetical protein [Saprospiraceae bacterium]
MKRLIFFLVAVTCSVVLSAQNVGIGVADPLDLLHVKNGDLRIENTVPSILLYQGATHGSTIGQFSNNLIFHNHEVGSIGFNINGGTHMLINSSGNVGIGTSSPTARLDVVGQIRFRTGAINGFVATTDAAGNLSWTDPDLITGHWTDAADDIYNSNSGNVGVGTATPAEQLHVAGGVRIDNVLPQLNFYQGGVFSTFIQSGADNLVISNKKSGNIDLLTNDVIRMSVANNGNVGIGNFVPQDRLHVAGGQIRIEHDAPTLKLVQGGNLAAAFGFGLGATYIGNQLNGPLLLQTNGVTRMTINALGQIGIGMTSPQYLVDIASDLRVDNGTLTVD